MDPTIVSATIGALATIAAVVIGWWLQKKKSQRGRRIFPAKPDAEMPDEDDVYFMTFLLHDAYEQSQPLSTAELAEHHLKYAPLELEVKLIRLERLGYIHRTNRKDAGLGQWQILPKGVEFMFANGHQLRDLIEEQRPGYKNRSNA